MHFCPTLSLTVEKRIEQFHRKWRMPLWCCWAKNMFFLDLEILVWTEWTVYVHSEAKITIPTWIMANISNPSSWTQRAPFFSKLYVSILQLVFPCEHKNTVSVSNYMSFTLKTLRKAWTSTSEKLDFVAMWVRKKLRLIFRHEPALTHTQRLNNT